MMIKSWLDRWRIKYKRDCREVRQKLGLPKYAIHNPLKKTYRFRMEERAKRLMKGKFEVHHDE